MLGFSSSSSKASQTNQTVSDSGQLIGNKSNVAQSGSFQLAGKNSSYGAINLSGAKLQKGSTIEVHTGMDQDGLNQLLGNVTQATSEQLAAFQDNTASQLNALKESSESTLSQFSKLFASKTDSETGSPRLIVILAVVSMVVIAGVLYLFKRN